MDKKIKVLIVDDSALIRQMLKEVFASSDEIEVVGVAADPLIARDKIKQLNPDVLTLDVEMPRMNGLQFLTNLMRLRPMPVVMVSTLTEAGAPETLEALEIGAVDYIAKPQAQDSAQFSEFAQQLIEKVRMAASARVRPLSEQRPLRAMPPKAPSVAYKRWICIGSSTGGTEAIKELLADVPAQCPPIVITQHIPAVFSASFAMRLNAALAMEVCEAQDGLEVIPGRVIIAQGDKHLSFTKEGGRYYCRLLDSERVNRHKPSVEIMFDALAEVMSPTKLVAVMLTGMGADGAQAMKRLRDGGALTLAQDEATSVVWGMPKAAHDLGAAEQLVSLPKMAEQMLAQAAKA